MKNIVLRLATSFLLTVILILNSFSLSAQNNAPIILSDTIDVSIGEFITINPVMNDYDPDGDIFLPELASFINGSGTVVMVGSNFEIKINNYTPLTKDTIQYMIKDQHGMMSTPGYIIVNIAPSLLRDTLYSNNVKVPLTPWGFDCVNRNTEIKFIAPRDSNTSSITTMSPWFAGYDSQNILHSALRRYDCLKSDFMYGPINNNIGNHDDNDSVFNRVWKITKVQILQHQSNYSNSNYTTPESILNWPAHGDVGIGQATNLAPFVDTDNDGVYIPQNGDYPQIKGDECVLSIFNDNVIGSNGDYEGIPIKVEIHQMTYSYNCPFDSLMDNTIFISYDFYNRSQNNYDDFRIGINIDFDIGDGNDDYVGCDTLLNSFYAYNVTNTDYPGEGSYGVNPPAQGAIILNHDMTSFAAYYNFPPNNILLSDPESNIEAYNLLGGYLKSGDPIYEGDFGIIGNNTTKFYYSGDISDSNQWSESSAGHPGYDIRGLGNIGPFNFVQNQKITVDLALVYAEGYGFTNLQNVDLLKKYLAKVQIAYDNGGSPCSGNVGISNETNTPEIGFSIYPNPTSGDININSNIAFHNADYKIYSMLGQFVDNGILKNNSETISVSNLQTGIYFLSIVDGSKTYSQKFIIK